MKPPRLFVVGGAGGPSLCHLDDKAMLEANPLAFRQLIKNVEFTRREGPHACFGANSVAGSNVDRLGPGYANQRLCSRDIGKPPSWASTKGSTISDADVQHYCPGDANEYLELEAG